MTTILIKKKDTAGAPAPGDLTNAAGGTEIAVNTATRRIYTKDSTGTVVELGNNATSSTIVDLTVTNSTTLSYGTANQVQYLNGSKLLVGSANMTFNGTTLTVNDLTDSSLTATRVVYAGTGGNLADSANMTFNGTTLTTGGLTTTGTTSTGVLSVTGNATLGDASTDTLTINSKITSDLIFTDNSYDIGNSGANRPRSLYLASTGNIGGNLLVKTSTARANITTDANLVSENGLGILATSTTYGQGYQYIRLLNSAAAYAGSISQTASTGIGLFSAGDLILGANSATVVTVAPTSVGFFGNSQNNTWGVNYKALDVNGSFVTANGGNTIVIGTGAYLSAAGNWTRTTTDASSTYTQSVGGHTWTYAAASTVGSTITYTNLAYLNTTGYGIGVFPEYKLDVFGGSGSIATARVWNGSSGGSDGAQLLLGNSANYTNAYFRLNGGGNSSQLGVGSLNIGLVENAPLGLYTSNALRLSVTGAGKVIVGAGTTPYGKLFVDDGNATNQNSITVTAANGSSAGDWVAMQQAFAGSWSTNLNGMALISVTDNLASGTTSAVVGQYGIGFNGGGYFAVKKLYNGSYGGSGTVFQAGLSEANFSGNIVQSGTVNSQAGVVTTCQLFDINASTNRRIQVVLSNYTWTKFRIYGLRTNSGNSIILWEGVLNNNFNTSFTNVIASVSGGGTLSLTVSSPSSGIWNFDFNNSGSGASGYYVKEDPGYGTVTVTSY